MADTKAILQQLNKNWLEASANVDQKKINNSPVESSLNPPAVLEAPINNLLFDCLIRKDGQTNTPS